MFKIKIIALGKFKEKAFVELEKEYLKRLPPFVKIKIVELPEEPYRNNDDTEKIKQKEAEKIVKQLSDDALVILLEEKGTLRSSRDFANFLERVGGFGRELVFVIGSGLGLHSSLKEHANYSISLSPLTFTHNFARVLLEEQLYRACTIINKKEYHK